MSDEPCEYSAGDRLVRGKVTEVDLTPRLRMNPRSAEFWFVVAAVPIVALTCWVVVPMDSSSGMGPFAAIAVIALLLMAGVAILAFSREVSSRGITQGLKADPDIGLEELLHRHARFVDMTNSTYPAKSVLNAILRIRGGGFSVRSFRKPMPASFKPIAEPFEPQPLDESAPSFQSTQGDESKSGLEWPRRLTRLMGGWGSWAGMAYFLLLSAYMLYRGAWSLPMVAIFVAIACAPILRSAGGAYSGGRQWLAVPGGVVIRKARPFRSGWEMQYVRREDGVLLVHKIPNRAWWALVVFSGGQEETHLTEREADFLLRAWLSPVPPPERDRLVELT
ncbi:MAG: hypothetical protein J5J06_10285 [Phycisphaerae bacterium]|nr:hypothetical protein [Phycisphaerae bacterium]